jgi:hypothetical protein
MSDEQGTFIVHWTDYVANDWTEIVQGPYEETDRRLTELAERGVDDFEMKHFSVGNSSPVITPTKTTAEFFALDWAKWLDPEDDEKEYVVDVFIPFALSVKAVDADEAERKALRLVRNASRGPAMLHAALDDVFGNALGDIAFPSDSIYRFEVGEG